MLAVGCTCLRAVESDVPADGARRRGGQGAAGGASCSARRPGQRLHTHLHPNRPEHRDYLFTVYSASTLTSVCTPCRGGGGMLGALTGVLIAAAAEFITMRASAIPVRTDLTAAALYLFSARVPRCTRSVLLARPDTHQKV